MDVSSFNLSTGDARMVRENVNHFHLRRSL
jgi:hypothetical protein